MPEFHQRVGVLQQLGYVSPDNTVTLKGRAACEINSTQVGSDGGRHAVALSTCRLSLLWQPLHGRGWPDLDSASGGMLQKNGSGCVCFLCD